MGFVNKNFTLVTSLTQKGREYFLSKNKNKFNVKFFALSDSDTNYIVASSNTSPFIYNTLKLGYVPNISGYNDSTIDCLRYIANGITQKYSVGGNDGDCAVISEFINPFTNELSCNKVDYPIIYPFTSTLSVDMVNSLGVLFPTGKDSFGNNIILFNEKDNSVDDFNFDVFLGLRNNVSVNDNYDPYGLESYSFLLKNLNDNIISIDNEQALNINNNLLNQYRFEKNQTNVVKSFNFKVDKTFYNTLNNYGLNDLVYADYFKADFIDGIIENLPSTVEIPLEKKSYIVKAYKATTVSIDDNNVIDLGDIKQYVTNGIGSIKIINKFLLNSKSPNGLEQFDVNISSNNNNNITNLRFDNNNDKNNLGLKYGVSEDIINISDNDIKFGFDESTIPNGTNINIDLQLKLSNPNKFVFIDSILNNKTFKLNYNKIIGVYFEDVSNSSLVYNFSPDTTDGILENNNYYAITTPILWGLKVNTNAIINDDLIVDVDIALKNNIFNNSIISDDLSLLNNYQNSTDPLVIENNLSYQKDGFYYEILSNTSSSGELISSGVKTKIPSNIKISGWENSNDPQLFNTFRPILMFKFIKPLDETITDVSFDVVYKIKPNSNYEIIGSDTAIIRVNGKINKQFKYINTPFITDSLILNEIQYKVTEGRYKLQTILLSKSKIINKDNVNSLNLNIKINQYTSYEVKLYVNNILVATLTKTKVIGRNIVSFDENSIRTNGMYGTSDTFTRNQITSDYTINLIDIKKSDNIKVEYLTYSNSFDNKGSFDLNIDTVEKIAI